MVSMMKEGKGRYLERIFDKTKAGSKKKCGKH